MEAGKVRCAKYPIYKRSKKQVDAMPGDQRKPWSTIKDAQQIGETVLESLRQLTSNINFKIGLVWDKHGNLEHFNIIYI